MNFIVADGCIPDCILCLMIQVGIFIICCGCIGLFIGLIFHIKDK